MLKTMSQICFSKGIYFIYREVVCQIVSKTLQNPVGFLYKDREEFEAGLHKEIMTIATIADQPTQSKRKAAIVIKEIEVLEVNVFPRRCALLMHITCAPNLSSAKNLNVLLKYCRSYLH